MPAIGPDTCRALVAEARVGCLATVTPAGAPHVVPVCFALVAGTIVTAVDAKPKRRRPLQREANLRAHPVAALLVDHYDDDWTELWWVRVDARATVVERDADALGALTAKYAQYRTDQPSGPVFRLHPQRWTGWSYVRRE